MAKINGSRGLFSHGVTMGNIFHCGTKQVPNNPLSMKPSFIAKSAGYEVRTFFYITTFITVHGIQEQDTLGQISLGRAITLSRFTLFGTH